MKKLTTFEWAVLALAAAILLIMVGRFAFGGLRPANAWRVDVERNDSPQTSVSQEDDGTPDSLLEGETININTAPLEELMRLPGVGQTRAQAIVDYRQEQGSFASVDELDQVKGIGPALLEELRPYICVE